MPSSNPSNSQDLCLLSQLKGRSIVLVGSMGVGKTSLGRRLAQRLSLDFSDSDHEIEAASSLSIADLFRLHGEPFFREKEQLVIARLLDGAQKVLSVGGGAFLHPKTRDVIRHHAVSVWLRAPLDLILDRLSRRPQLDQRPLLSQGDRRETLKRLLEERSPFYAQADVICETHDDPLDIMVQKLIERVIHSGV